MNEQLFGEMDLEKRIHAGFNLWTSVKSVIAERIPVGTGAAATVFLTDKGLLFALIAARGAQNLGDVKKILTRMNLRAEQFLPPHADAGYFDRIATAKFREVFPARDAVHNEDLIFYRTLAPYNPALVQIAEVVDGAIRQYDSDAVGHWRTAVKFSYRRIRTS